MSTAYLVQGLRGNSLVAGKTTALRLVTAPWSAAGADAVQLSIVRPDGSVVNRVVPKTQLVTVDVGKSNESVVVRIAGATLEDVGIYFLQAKILTAIGSIAVTHNLDNVELLPTKDLRMMVSRVWSGTAPPAKPGEVEAATEAMIRLATLYPIRDGISTLDGDYNAGLRYNFDDNPQGPPAQDGNLGPAWDLYRNPPAGKDGLDCAIAYRFPDADEASGASTQQPYKGWLPWSLIVWQGPVDQVFSHETGHNHGLEPSASPHFDPTGQAAHSNELTVETPDVDGGFDVQFDQPFPLPTYDIMYPSGPAPGYPAQSVSLNSWDWEFLRKKLITRGTTGPHEPYIRWQSLGGHGLRAGVCATRNRDGRLEVFALGADGALYHLWETNPGGPWSKWSSLAGHDLAGPIRAETSVDGRLEVFVVGADGAIYSRAQVVPNGDWGDWFRVGGDGVKGFAVARNADGRLEVVAVFSDGALHDAWQLTPGGGWSGWASLDGHDLKGPVALVPNADGRLEAFAVGGNDAVYHRWQTTSNGQHGWAAWTLLVDSRFAGAEDLTAARAGDGRIFVIIMSKTKSINSVSQNNPNGAWGSVADMFGHGLRWPCALGRADDGRLEIAVIGGDRKLYSRWQVDAARSALWSNWTPLGGKEIQAGVALAANHTGQLEVFVVGGDGALYRGPRTA